MASYEKDLFDLIERIKNQVRASPLYLGGIASVAGGAGGPPGGFIGQLPQKRVACDLTEDDTTFVDVSTIPSGISLVTNLNNIRYRIKQVEDGYIPEPSGVVSGQVLGFNGTDWVGVDQAAGSGVGASSFLELTDTPASYAGQVGKAVVVNDTENGLDFVTISGVGGTDITATDSSTINFTVTDNNITGFVISSGIKLDDLGTPDDNTDLNATTGHHGLLPKLSGNTSQYLNGQGSWVTVSGGEGGGHAIQDDGIPLTTRSNLNFVGDGVIVTDDEANNATIVTVAGGSGVGSGDMLKSVYDTDNDGIVNEAENVQWSGILSKPSTFAPSAHSTSHKSGGSDLIKLDELATPNDNTVLNASTLRHGLLPKLSGNAGDYLNGQGIWTTISGGGGGHTIQDEGTSLTQRTKLNFIGSGVTVTDDSTNDATLVTIAASSGTGGGTTVGDTEIRTLIYDYVVASGGMTTIDFDIPQDYDDLDVLMIGRSEGALASRFVIWYFNEDYTDTNYFSMRTSFLTASGDIDTNYAAPNIGVIPGATALADTFGYLRIHLPMYSHSGTFQQLWNGQDHHRYAATAGYRSLWSGYWESTDAITKIRFTPGSGDTFAVGTIIRLVGIKYGNILTP